MAVEDKGARIPYDCDGSQKDFPFGFSVYDKADLKVYHRYTELGEEKEELLVDGVGYTVSSAYSHYRKGGVVSTTTAYPSPDKIILLNDPELKQVADYERGDGLPSQEHENAMDRAYIALQKQRDALGLVLSLMVTSSFKDLTLPDPVANMLMSWKDNLSGLKNIDFKAPSGSFTLTPFAETIFDDEDAAAARTTLGAMKYLRDTGIKIGTSARDTAGDQVITGVGVETSLVLFLASDITSANKNFSIGIDNGTQHMCLRGFESLTNVAIHSSRSIMITREGGNFLEGYISAISSGELTITWALTGACSVQFIYCCLP